MMRARRDTVRNAIMADWWDERDVPAICDVQVEVGFEVAVKILYVFE